MPDPTLPAPHADVTPRLGIPLMHAGQAQKHITHNAALLEVERHLHPSVHRSDLGSPPADAESGESFVVAALAEGEWESRAGEVATRSGESWSYAAPEPGWTLWDLALGAHIVFDGTTWSPLASDGSSDSGGSGSGAADPNPAPETLGVGGAAADATNRLAVRSPATLLTHAESGSHRLALNREADSDTASVVFQTGFAGGAELGLVGTGDFEFKVSADGTDWYTALSVERSTGRVGFPAGGPRIQEGSNRAIYVSPTGDDAADGMAASRPVTSFVRAVDILSRIDAGGHAVIIQLAAGAYADNLVLDRLPVGASTVILRGPRVADGVYSGEGAARIEPTGHAPAVDVTIPGASLMVRDLHAQGTVGMRAQFGTVLNIRGGVSLGTSRGGVLIADGGKVHVVGTVELTGGLAALKAQNGGTVEVTSSTVKLASGAAWTDAFASAERLGQIVVNHLAVEGTATGKRYRAASNAVVEVANADLPGSVDGITATGGRYL